MIYYYIYENIFIPLFVSLFVRAEYFYGLSYEKNYFKLFDITMKKHSASEFLLLSFISGDKRISDDIDNIESSSVFDLSDSKKTNKKLQTIVNSPSYCSINDFKKIINQKNEYSCLLV